MTTRSQAVVDPRAVSTAEAPRSARYFVNPLVDFILIGGGSMAVYVLFRLQPHMASSPAVLSLAATLVWYCNYPHFAATNLRLYGRKDNLRQYPITAVSVPLIMIGTAVACYASPTQVAPMLVHLYLIWSPYHFSGQTIGIALLYARRAGFDVTKWERRALMSVVFLTFITQNARAEVAHYKANFYSVSYPTLGIPSWVPHVCTAAMFVSVGALGGLLMWRALDKRQIVPFMMLVPVAAQWIWFVGLPVNHVTGNYNALVPFFHSLQYLVIAWALNLRESMTLRKATPSGRYVLSESARWAVVIGILGWVLFWGVPHLGAHFGKPLAFSTAIMLAVIQLHHFFVDGVIWKLRNPNVRSPLSTTLGELTGHRPSPDAPAPAPVAVAAAAVG